MKKMKLKGFVLPTAYVIGVTLLFLGIMYVGSNVKDDYVGDYIFSTSLFTDNLIPVVNDVEEEKISKPFDNANVTISKYFYNKDADDTNKESSIIYYENTYMQNTGVLYSADEQFDVLASLSGTVTNIKDDDILGKVVYVEYNTKLTIVYYSLESTDLKIGDQVDQGAVIGKSGSNKLENEKKYSLLIEVYLYLYNIKNKKLLYYKFNNSIFEGRIIKQNNIIKKLNEILKEEKISKVFSIQKAYVLYEPHLKYIDKKIIIDTFEQCGFKDLKLVNTKELVDKNNIFLEINNNYLIVYNNSKYEILRKNNYIDLNTIIKLVLKKDDDNIYLIGINNEIENIVLLNNRLFYLENSNRYFIDKIFEKLTRTNKTC